MKDLPFDGENAIIIGDSYGPFPVELSRTGFDFTGSIITHIIYKDYPDSVAFTKTPTLDVSVLGKLSFDLYLTPAETTTIKAGNLKQTVKIAWPNGTDKNTLFGGKVEFKHPV